LKKPSSKQLRVGTVNGAYGIKGWSKVFSYTDPAEQIFSYRPWLILSRNELVPVEIAEWRWQGSKLVARLKHCESRNDADRLVGSEIFVASEQLAALEENEFYWHELEGLAVCNLLGESLGVVGKLMETGANDVLLVEDECDGTRVERLIPYVWDQVVKKVDIEAGLVTVDWLHEYDQ
jgi:16S rRNA processing protein RimM